ncbi:MAG: hypothetical protein RJB66_840 [Pseudomonadota bacterium]|jgi:tRNA pseudouridine65 synthase
MNNEITVLAENSDFIAIDKPTSISAHNEDSSGSNVLQLMGKGLHLVHRLDKETSGVLLLAKNSRAAHLLMVSLAQPKTEKTYCAILRGSLQCNDMSSTLDWNAPISDKAEGRQNPQGMRQNRLDAKTVVTIQKNNRYFTKISAVIHTGRQHQIRKHAALAKHPILGDSRYNDKKYNEKIFDLYGFKRMLLHAERLIFSVNEDSFEILAPIPQIFDHLINSPPGDR